MTPRANLWIENEAGEVAMSEWRMRLLEAIADTGSLSAAARALEVDYRTAWRKLKEMEVRLGLVLTERQAGGDRGGGTRLTPAGLDQLHRFRRFARGLERIVERQFHAAYVGKTTPGGRARRRRRPTTP